MIPLSDIFIKGFIKENEGDVRMVPYLDPLKAASKDVQAAATFFMNNAMKNPNAALAGSYDFMTMMGHTCLGLMWAKMARMSGHHPNFVWGYLEK